MREWTIDELDFLHAYVGLGPEWWESDARHELVAVDDQG